MQRTYSSMYGRLLFFICLLFIQDADMSCNNTDFDMCQCSNGRYGGECEMPCSPNCKRVNGSPLCNKPTGTCSNGCKQGWCKKTCTTACGTNCRKCLSYNCECDGCKNGYYGGYCEKRCEKHCSRCDQDTGDCICEAPIYTNISRSENPQNEKTTEGNPVLRSFGWGWLSCVIISTVIFVVDRLMKLYNIRCCKCRGKRDERAQTQQPRQPETLELNQPETQEPSHEHGMRSLCKKHFLEHCVFYFLMFIACVIGVILVICGYCS